MILANILGSLFGVLCIALTWLWLRRIYREIKRTRATVENDSGDQGGIPQPIESRRAVTHPRAPDTGSGLLDGVGHPTAGQKIIAGLEDAVAHARGDSSRAKVTHYPRKEGD